MANDRARQLEKISLEDPLRRISAVVFERVTDESRPMPRTMDQLATEIVKDNPGLVNNREEIWFLWDCLDTAAGLEGLELREDVFHEKVLAVAYREEKYNERDQAEAER